MFHHYYRLLPISALTLLSLAATRQQEPGDLNLAWWIWLVLIAIILLFTFVVLVAMDWRGAESQGEGEEEEA